MRGSHFLLLLVMLLVFAAFPLAAFAECLEVNGQVRCTDETTVTADGGGYSYDSLRRSMYFVLGTILQIAGLAAVAAIVFYGVKMAVSRGDPARFAEAKKGLLYALLGALVIFGIYTILATVRGAADALKGGRGGQQEVQITPALERSKDR